MLPLINRFPNKPLIYNIAWKTVIYLLISAVLHYLERLIDFWRQTGSFVAGNEKLLSVIIWPHFFAIQILLFVLIAMYCTMHELVRVIGREKALRIFFGPMPAPEVEKPINTKIKNNENALRLSRGPTEKPGEHAGSERRKKRLPSVGQ